MLGNFSHDAFCCLLILFKIHFFEKFFREYYQCQMVWIQIRTDVHSVGPDLGPNILQRLSADDNFSLARINNDSLCR